MDHIKYLIFGAGIAGLSSAAQLKEKGENDFTIIDKTSELPKNFKNGLHYLHSSDFGTPFPFEFKKIVITEEIWDTRNNIFKKQASIPEMFEYSKKVMENIRHPSSIMDPGKRLEVWVPESNNMDDLTDAYYHYINEAHFIWNNEIISIDLQKQEVTVQSPEKIQNKFSYEYIISSIPLNILYDICGLRNPYELKHKAIYITNYKTKNIVPNWLIVLYMSDPKFPPYRITILNNNLSMESLVPLTYDDEVIIKYIIGDLFDYNIESKISYIWETGRIFGLNKIDRFEMLRFFNEKNIYPVGRFAQWDGKLLIDSTIIQAKNIIHKIS